MVAAVLTTATLSSLLTPSARSGLQEPAFNAPTEPTLIQMESAPPLALNANPSTSPQELASAASLDTPLPMESALNLPIKPQLILAAQDGTGTIKNAFSALKDGTSTIKEFAPQSPTTVPLGPTMPALDATRDTDSSTESVLPQDPLNPLISDVPPGTGTIKFAYNAHLDSFQTTESANKPQLNASPMIKSETA